jgi:hypothetical protein
MTWFVLQKGSPSTWEPAEMLQDLKDIWTQKFSAMRIGKSRRYSRQFHADKADRDEGRPAEVVSMESCL